MRPLAETLRQHGARDRLQSLLSEEDATVSLEALLDVARKGKNANQVARSAGIESRSLAGLAILTQRAETLSAADALSHTGSAVVHNPHPEVKALVRLLEGVAEREPGPYLTADGQPVVFVVSFPRSGNTRFLNILDGAFPRSRHTAFMHEARYFSEKGTGIASSGPVFVKDHHLRAAYQNNPVIYLARDGRDCALSFNDFILRRPDMTMDDVVAGSESLHFVTEPGVARNVDGPPYGGWPAHVNAALNWREKGRPIAILKYEDLLGDGGFGLMRGALERFGIPFSEADYAKGVDVAEERQVRLRTTNDRWARDAIYPTGSLMDRWLARPEASKWRDVLTEDARQSLHKAGYTGILVAAGYETDRSWWRA